MQVKTMLRSAGLFLKRNSPYILTGMGCAGVVSTAVLAGRAAVKANDEISDINCKRLMDGYEVCSAKEKVMLTWKYFIPPVVMGATSMACIVGAQSVQTKRHAALASLYTLTEQTLKDYRENVVDLVGKNKEEKAYTKVAQDKVLENPPQENQIILTKKGDTLFKDSYSGRYFKSDIEALRRIQNELNHQLVNQMWVPINDLYTIVGLDPIKLGEDIGWNPDELIEFKFIPTIFKDDEVCVVLDYEVKDFK